VAPQCVDTDVANRHPALRPGRTLLWLEAEIHRRGEHDTTVILVIPPPLSSFRLEVFWPYFELRMPALQAIVGADHTNMCSTQHSSEIVAFDVAAYERTRPLREAAKWAPQRISGIACLTPALVDFFEPLLPVVPRSNRGQSPPGMQLNSMQALKIRPNA
jgi:hypothetical protein